MKIAIKDKFKTSTGAVVLFYSNGKYKLHPSEATLKKRKEFLQKENLLKEKKSKETTQNKQPYYVKQLKKQEKVMKNCMKLIDSIFNDLQSRVK